MKIGICHRPASFSDRWIDYCELHNIDYKLVDAYASNVIEQLRDCNGFMWHWNHYDYRNQIFARQLTLALEASGKLVFPSANTSWHFDDKLGQKYLFESVGAQYVASYVFYDKNSAIQWAKKTDYPKVFKLRGGAGSLNVRLVYNVRQAQKLIQKSFGSGFNLIDRTTHFRDGFWVIRRDKNIHSILLLGKKLFRVFFPSRREQLLPIQKGYVYFQDFVPDNTFDDRLIVIGNRCFFIRRQCRNNDFRASGSGQITYNHLLISEEAIKIAFTTAKKLNLQSVAYDFIYDKNKNKPLIVEMSYAFSVGKVYDSCDGYWDDQLIWHNQPVNPQFFIIEDFIKQISDHIASCRVFGYQRTQPAEENIT